MIARHMLLAAVLLSGAAAGCAPASRQPGTASAAAPRATHGVVLLVQTPQQLEVAVASATQLASEPGVVEVRVLACGPAVGALRDGGPLDGRVPALNTRRVHVVACGLSLAHAGIDAASLAPGVEVVPNAIIEIVHLQRDGYLSVEL